MVSNLQPSEYPTFVHQNNFFWPCGFSLKGYLVRKYRVRCDESVWDCWHLVGLVIVGPQGFYHKKSNSKGSRFGDKTSTWYRKPLPFLLIPEKQRTNTLCSERTTSEPLSEGRWWICIGIYQSCSLMSLFLGSHVHVPTPLTQPFGLGQCNSWQSVKSLHNDFSGIQNDPKHLMVPSVLLSWLKNLVEDWNPRVHAPEICNTVN
jgi:hypothetical protein